MCSVTISERDLFALFATEAAAVEFFEAIRWPNGPACPVCESADVVPKSGHPFFYRCRVCRKQFSAKFGTVLQASPLPVRVWLHAMYKVVIARKGVSSLQLSKELGITQKPAWHLVHRLKEACLMPSPAWSKWTKPMSAGRPGISDGPPVEVSSIIRPKARLSWSG